MGFIWKTVMRQCRKLLGRLFILLHKDLTDTQWQTFEQFIRFALVGCSNSLVSLVICYIIQFVLGTGYYILGQTLGYIAAVFNSFFWNSKYVFHVPDMNRKIVFGKMCLCNIVVYALQIGSVYLLVDILAVSTWIAPVVAIFISLPVNFCMNKFFAFRKGH